MYPGKTLVAVMALLLTGSLASPVQAAAPSAAPAPDPASIPDFSTPANDTNLPTFMAEDGRYDECGGSSVIDQTSKASPRVADCLQIATNIANNGLWEVEAFVHQQHQLVQFGTCAFGVQAVNTRGTDAFFYVGNQDIIDLIRFSVTQFGDSGLVGSKGTMQCAAALQPPLVNWGIYHTK